MKKKNLHILRRNFSVTSSRKPNLALAIATTTIASLPRSISIGFAVAIGFSSFFYSVWLAAEPDMSSFDTAYQYLPHLERFINALESDLHVYDKYIMQDILRELVATNFVHELT